MASFGSASLTKQCETSDAGNIITQTSDSSVPAHYVLEINSFPMLSTNNVDKYESNEFDAGCYKWKFVLYPKGDNNTTNGDHVSLHVRLSSKIKVGEEIHATIRFSVFDQLRAKYFTKQGGAEMFNRMKLDWGISKFMPLKIFTDPSSGYLVDNECLFGVGVFVIKSSGLGDSLALKDSPSTHFHEWKITNYSSFGSKTTCSEDFIVGNNKWHFLLFPQGDRRYCDDHLSLFYTLRDPAPGRKIHASYTIRLKGRDGVVHKEAKGNGWFSTLKNSCGWTKYMCLKEFRKCIVDGNCIIEADVAVLGEVSKLV